MSIIVQDLVFVSSRDHSQRNETFIAINNISFDRTWNSASIGVRFTCGLTDIAKVSGKMSLHFSLLERRF